MNSLPRLLVLVLALWSNVGVALGQTPPSSTSHRPRVRVLAGGYGNYADGSGPTARFYQPAGVAVGPDGVLYVADTENNRIRRVQPDGQVSTLAGTGEVGTTDGPAATARFTKPRGIAVDARGTVYVTENYSSVIRKITPAGQVSSLTGLDRSALGALGYDKVTRFGSLDAIAVDAAGAVYVANDGIIFKITPGGVVSTRSWFPPPGFATTRSDTLVQLVSVDALAVGPDGTVYVADGKEERVCRISPSGRVRVLAGNQKPRTSMRSLRTGLFHEPNGLVVDAQSAVYVTDGGTLRKITPDGQISTLNNVAQGPTDAPRYAFEPGTRAHSFPAAAFSAAWGLALGTDGTVYVGDRKLHGIVAISPEGLRRVLAGGVGADTRVDAQGLAARFQSPSGVAVDSRGTVYVADRDNHCIRIITASGQVSTLAGTGEPGFADGPGRAARFASPWGVAVGPGDTVYVADTNNHRIRKITPQGLVSTLAGSGRRGFANGAGPAARFTRPTGVAVAANGAVYAVDSADYVRRIAANGRVSTAVDLTPWGHGYGVGTHGIALARGGTLYVSGVQTGRVYKVTPAGKVSILAGCGLDCDPYEEGTGAYSFRNPTGIAASAGGTLYVTDSEGNAVRRISPNGQVSMLLDDRVRHLDRTVIDRTVPSQPQGIAVDAAGRVYIADTENNLILVVE